MTPEIGRWYRVTSGPQKGCHGVCDLITDYPVGTRYRITNRCQVVGRFPAEMLVESPQAAFESTVSPEIRQAALNLLTGRLA